jgi:hypothetical protein
MPRKPGSLIGRSRKQTQTRFAKYNQSDPARVLGLYILPIP